MNKRQRKKLAKKMKRGLPPYPALDVSRLSQVQPMTGPTALVFHLEIKEKKK